MAVIKCPECKKKVSTTVNQCPHCGYILTEDDKIIKEKAKVNSPKSNKKIGIISIGIILIVIILGILFFTSGKANTDKVAKSLLVLYGHDSRDEVICTGSGFIYLDDSTIITNFHVIESVSKVIAKDEEGNEYEISGVQGYDVDKDIAVLKTSKPTGLSVIKGNTKSLKKGDDVTAIGSPKGLVNTVSTGVVSAIRNENGIESIQISAAISSGSSGGVLLNKKGQAIGITYAGYDEGQNLNFAIPIKYVDDCKRDENKIQTFDDVRKKDGVPNGADNYEKIVSIQNEDTNNWLDAGDVTLSNSHLEQQLQDKEMYLSGYVANAYYFSELGYTDVLIVPSKKYVDILDGAKNDLLAHSEDLGIEDTEYKQFRNAIEKEYIEKVGHDDVPDIYIRYTGNVLDQITFGDYINVYGKIDILNRAERFDIEDYALDITENEKFSTELFAIALYHDIVLICE